MTDAEGRKVFKGRQTHRLPFKMYDDEARFYEAVAEYIRNGYQMLERAARSTAPPRGRVPADHVSEAQRQLDGGHPVGPDGRLLRLRGELCRPARNEEEPELLDERYEGEHEEQDALLTTGKSSKDEVAALEALLAMQVKRDKKLDELLRLIDHIAKESPRATKRRS